MLTNIGECARKALQEAGFVFPSIGRRVDVVRSVYDSSGSREIEESSRDEYASLEDVAIAFVKYCAEYTNGQVKIEGRKTLVMVDKKFGYVHKWTVTEHVSMSYSCSEYPDKSFEITIRESRRAEEIMLTKLPKLEVVE